MTAVSQRGPSGPRDRGWDTGAVREHPALPPLVPGRIAFARVGLFAGLPDRDLAHLESRLTPIPWPKGAPAPPALTRDDCLFVVRSGRLSLLEDLAGARRVMIALLEPGALYSRLGSAPLPAVEPLEDSSVSPIPRQAVELLSSRYPRLALNLADALSDRVAMLRQTVAVVSAVRVADRLRARVHQLVERHGVATRDGARLPLELTHGQWAALVGSSREAVSAAFGRLRAQGAVVRDDAGIVVPWEAFRAPDARRP